MREHYRIKIEYDADPESPRRWENISTMLCWHDRYDLGDANPYKSRDPHEAMLSIISDYNEDFADQLDEKDLKGKEYYAAIEEEFEKYHVVLPLYLYDHSGITMSTGSFGCRWDSGQVGFIYISHKTANNELGGPEFEDKTTWTTSKSERCRKMLEGDVRVYDQYLTGQVYGFTIEKLIYEFEIPIEEIDVEDDKLPWKHDDSCWGFYGDDIDGDEANGILDHIGSCKAAARLAAVKAAMNNPDKWVELPPETDEKDKTDAA